MIRLAHRYQRHFKPLMGKCHSLDFIAAGWGGENLRFNETQKVNFHLKATLHSHFNTVTEPGLKTTRDDLAITGSFCYISQ